MKVVYIPKPDSEETIPCFWLSLPDKGKSKEPRKLVIVFHGVGTNLGTKRL